MGGAHLAMVAGVLLRVPARNRAATRQEVIDMHASLRPHALAIIAGLALAFPGEPVDASGTRREDCKARGPMMKVAGADYPVILESYTGADTNGPGCDGCNAIWEVLVVWDHVGKGRVVDWNGDVRSREVEKGQVSEFCGEVAIDCGGRSEMTAYNENCGSSAEIWFVCEKCR